MEIRQHPLFSKIIDLTLAVYRVTSFFPHGESLHDQIRNKANLILAHAVKLFYFAAQSPDSKVQDFPDDDFFSEIDILRGYFAVARNQGWVKEVNFEVLDSAYNGVKHEFREYFSESLKHTKGEGVGLSSVKTKPPSIDSKKKIEYNIHTLPSRQKKIFEYVVKNGKTLASDLEPILEGVNIRTIRRDLEELAKLGLMCQEVKGRQIFFWIKKTQVA